MSVARVGARAVVGVHLAALLGGLALAPRRSGAQALTLPNVGTGMSGPAEVDPAGVYWNPALNGFIERPTVLLGGSLVVGSVLYQRERRATYQRRDSLAFALPIPDELVDPSRSGYAAPVSATPAAVAPTLFLAVPVVRDRVVVSFGVYTPYAAALQFDPDGAQRFQLQTATIAAVYFTPSVAVRVHPMVSLGAGISYVLGFAELSRVQDFAGSDDVGRGLANPPIAQRNDFGASAPPGLRELDVLARPIRLRNMWAHGVSFNAGVALRPARNLVIGLSYTHSTDLTFAGQFQLDMNDPFFTRDLASQGLRFDPLIQGDATLSFPLPRSIQFGLSYQVNARVGIGLMAGYTTWSQVQTFDVRVRSAQLAQPAIGLADTTQVQLRRDWQDTVAIELTGRYNPTERWTLWLTGGYRSPASPDTTIDVASPDGHRVVAAAGAALRVDAHWRLLGDVEVQTLIPRRVVASDHDLGNGNYDLTLVNLGLHTQYTF